MCSINILGIFIQGIKVEPTIPQTHRSYSGIFYRFLQFLTISSVYKAKNKQFIKNANPTFITSTSVFLVIRAPVEIIVQKSLTFFIKYFQLHFV